MVGFLTYEEAQRRRAGGELCQQLRQTEGRVSDEPVVVCRALLAA